MSLVSIAEVRALVRSRLSDTDLQAVIDREEAWLAGRVGLLSGVRTETYRPGLGDTPLYLRRRAESVLVTDDGVTLTADTDYLFSPSTGELRRTAAGAWSGTVTATWTPTDESAVKRAVIELVRLAVGETGFDSETIGDYAYSRGASAGRLSRAGLARSLLIRRPAYSMRLHSGMEQA